MNELAEKLLALPEDKIAFATLDEIAVCSIEDFINQPIEGILYDLNRDLATTIARLENHDVRAINDLACARLITYLINKLNATMS